MLDCNRRRSAAARVSMRWSRKGSVTSRKRLTFSVLRFSSNDWVRASWAVWAGRREVVRMECCLLSGTLIMLGISGGHAAFLIS
jgi:hypothetical protein